MKTAVRTRLRPGANERGAVLVEAALVFPVLFLVVFGALEYGLLFRDDLTGTNVVRAGGRVISAQANRSRADQLAIQAMLPAAAAFSDGLPTVSRVVVYMASCANPAAYTGPTTSRCGSAAPIKNVTEMLNAANCVSKASTAGVNGRCNVYTPAQLTTSWANSGTWGCVAGSFDGSWCPSTRIASQAAGTDYVGIHIEYSHSWVTGLFGSKRDLTDDVVFRVEPQGV
jgi:Flp pilus assembly protein TadG